MSFIQKQNIIFNNKKGLKRDQLLKEISKASFNGKYSSDAEGVFASFIKRENQGTTGFEDGFAIPHARSKFVNQAQIYVYRNMEGIADWKTLDGNPVTVAIALLIPENAGNLHMDILSTIATKLIDEDFRENLKTKDETYILKEFQKIIKTIEEKQGASKVVEEKIDDSKKFFVAITACPAGIAHTYMAKEKLERKAKEMGYGIHVETQGGGKQKEEISEEQLARAEFVVIASDIKINLSRFIGKKVWHGDSNAAIKDPEKIILEAEKIEKELTEEDVNKKIGSHSNPLLNFLIDTRKNLFKVFGKPWVFLGVSAGIYAIISLLGYSLYGQEWITDGDSKSHILFIFQTISFRTLELTMPFFAATFARQIYDNSRVFVVTFVVAFIFNTPFIGSIASLEVGKIASGSSHHLKDFSLWWKYGNAFSSNNFIGSSLFGGILVAPIIAYLFKIHDGIMDKSKNKYLHLILSPWLAVVFTFIVFTLAIFTAAPLSYVMKQVVYGLSVYPNQHWWLRLIIGGIIGILITWDYGGPINKITILALIGLSQYDWRMRSLFAVAIPIASLSAGIFFKTFKKKLSATDAIEGIKSYDFGKRGLSEGPIHFVNTYKWKAQLPSVVAAFMATGLVFVFNIQVFRPGSIGIFAFGAQGYAPAMMPGSGDLTFLNQLVPGGKGAITFFASVAYGIVGYYLSYIIGVGAYFITGLVTFNLGKNKPFIKKEKNEITTQ